MRKHCLFNFIVANILLKKAADMELTLFEIGCIMYKNYEEESS